MCVGEDANALLERVCLVSNTIAKLIFVGAFTLKSYTCHGCGYGGTGRRVGLKNRFLHRIVGSIPTTRTIFLDHRWVLDKKRRC